MNYNRINLNFKKFDALANIYIPYNIGRSNNPPCTYENFISFYLFFMYVYSCGNSVELYVEDFECSISLRKS